jgi:predicted nucleic acid-binding protein
MNAVDTNILIYAHDTRYPAKLVIAETLIRTLMDGILLWQVACEYVAAVRYKDLALIKLGRMCTSYRSCGELSYRHGKFYVALKS